MHKEFSTRGQQRSKKVALSFKTIKNPHTVYLVPESQGIGRIQTQKTDTPQYVFEDGNIFTMEELISLNIGWEKFFPDTEN